MSDSKKTKTFSFVGSSSSTATTKIKWPVEVRARVLAANIILGKNAKEAFAVGLEPVSYTHLTLPTK